MKKFLLLRLSFLFLVVLVLASASAFAQSGRKQLVYLKNGSVVKGRLVQVEGEKWAVGSKGSTVFLNRSEIDSLKSFPAAAPEPDSNSRPWFAECSAGLLIGSADNQRQAPFSADLSANLRVVPQLYAGAGLGVDFLDESYMPVFVNLNYLFRNTPVTPFVGLKCGYLFALDGDVKMNQYQYFYDYNSVILPGTNLSYDNKGGFMINPSIGFLVWFSRNLGLSGAFGYRYSRVIFDAGEHYRIETNYNRLSVRIGILFN